MYGTPTLLLRTFKRYKNTISNNKRKDYLITLQFKNPTCVIWIKLKSENLLKKVNIIFLSHKK